MNTQTFKKRIAYAYKKDGELMKRFSKPIHYIETMAEGGRIYPYGWTSAKRHFNLQGEASIEAVKELCKKLKLALKRDNDAPRGGISGEFFYFEKKDINKLKDVKFSSLK